MATVLQISDIQTKIYEIRNQKIILDKDLAKLYQVETKYLVRQYKRNIERFPESFAFQLTKDEYLRCQNVTSSLQHGGRRYLPYAFTEHGTLMVASILKSSKAIQINQKVIEAFIELRKNILQQPEYKLLQETVKRIESRMDMIESNHLVDKTILSTKIQKMSQSIQEFSELMDQFQNTHVVIKRPNDGEING